MSATEESKDIEVKPKNYGSIENGKHSPDGGFRFAKGATKSVSSGAWGARHTFILLLGLGNTFCYMTRVNISVAIVAMVDTNVEIRGSVSFSPKKYPFLTYS